MYREEKPAAIPWLYRVIGIIHFPLYDEIDTIPGTRTASTPAVLVESFITSTSAADLSSIARSSYTKLQLKKATLNSCIALEVNTVH